MWMNKNECLSFAHDLRVLHGNNRAINDNLIAGAAPDIHDRCGEIVNFAFAVRVATDNESRNVFSWGTHQHCAVGGHLSQVASQTLETWGSRDCFCLSDVLCWS